MLTTTGTSKKELLSLHRKALTALCAIKLTNIHANIEFRLLCNDSDCTAAVTVFRHDGLNKTFNFYEFTSYEQNKENLDRVIKTIKLDSFQEIENTHINH